MIFDMLLFHLEEELHVKEEECLRLIGVFLRQKRRITMGFNNCIGR